MSRISISDKHGVNPAIPKCYFCGKDKNELIMAGRLKGDVEAPKGVAWDMNPCDECKGYMEQGVILMSVRDGEMEKVEKDQQLSRAEHERKHGWNKRRPFRYMPNPYRTGGWVVMKDDAIKRMVETPELQQLILEARWTFVPDEVWDAIGLPRGEA